MKTCNITDCLEPHHGKGMCKKHYLNNYYKNNRIKMLNQSKKYQKENSKKLVEKRKKQKAEYYLKNKERISKAHKEYRENNKEKEKARHLRWGQKNKDKKREAWRRREAKRKGNIVERYTETQVLDLYGTDCYLCNTQIDMVASRRCGDPGWEKGLHIEHVVDIAFGGPDTLANVRPSHAICNLTKKPNQNGIME